MRLIVYLALAVLIVRVALGQHQRFAVNPEASEVKMTLKTTHEVVSGTFHLQSGSVDFDRGGHKMAGAVVVLAASGDTGNGSRDKRMKNSILKVEQYTQVSFEPKSYTGTIAPSGDSAIDAAIQVSGIFTLLGTAHEITIPMVVHFDGGRATVKAHFVVPYVQWGVKNPSFLIWKADNDVAIDLNLVGAIGP